MGRAEWIILLTFALVGGSAFALEKAGPDAVRIIGITACCTLIALMVIGLIMRGRMKRRLAKEAPRFVKKDASN